MSHTGNPAGPDPAAETAGPVTAAAHNIHFWFEGRRFEGRAGDTIAKALFHNGIRTFSHSVKYGRPRSIHCGRGRCITCHVEVDGKTGIKSCLTPLADGMRIRRQNYKPFYGKLMTGILGRLSLPAGFYYRVFTRPGWVRRLFVNTVRRMAGVGRIDARSSQAHPLPPVDTDLANTRDRYDVLVVGSGMSGLTAALAASETGAGVLLVDEYDIPGGHSIGAHSDPDLCTARDDLVRRLGRDGGIDTAGSTTALGYYPPGRLLIGKESRGQTSGGARTVSAGAFVFATGAHDLTPLFENNDLPGVFGERALRLFAERDGLVPGNTAVVYGTGSGLMDAAFFLRSRGVRIVAIVDAGTPEHEPPADTRYERFSTLVRAEGREWISHAVFERRAGELYSLPCELLCIAAPGQPSFELSQQAGFRFELAGDRAAPDLRVLKPTADTNDENEECRVFLTGGAAGIIDWKQKIDHAVRAGTAAGSAARTV